MSRQSVTKNDCYHLRLTKIDTLQCLIFVQAETMRFGHYFGIFSNNFVI